MSRPASCDRLCCILALCLPLMAACEDGPVSSPRGTGLPPSKTGVQPKKSDADKARAELTLKDDDFVESERNRDPFRSYASSFTPAAHPVSEISQRTVVMPNTPVEQMRLIAVVSGLARTKAMLLDEKGVGYVVQRGDYLGRAYISQSAGNVEIAVNWRVDRIRENEVVLTRQDPGGEGRPPLSRIISMRDELAARM